MRSGTGPKNAARSSRALLIVLAVTALTGCLGKPKIEDRWTRVDLLGSNLTTGQVLPLGARESISVRAAITYRSIITGFAVAELRASSSISATAVNLASDAPRQLMAYDIDRILRNSVSVGRATRAVTGWDHLIQHIDFNFNAAVPAVVDSGGASSGLFLVCYLGSGDRIELPSGADSIVVTPFAPDAYELLPVGLELGVPGSGSH